MNWVTLIIITNLQHVNISDFNFKQIYIKSDEVIEIVGYKTFSVPDETITGGKSNIAACNFRTRSNDYWYSGYCSSLIDKLNGVRK